MTAATVVEALRRLLSAVHLGKAQRDATLSFRRERFTSPVLLDASLALATLLRPLFDSLAEASDGVDGVTAAQLRRLVIDAGLQHVLPAAQAAPHPPPDFAARAGTPTFTLCAHFFVVCMHGARTVAQC